MFDVRNETGIMPFYHNGNTKKQRLSQIPLNERPVITWDMEGMNLSGEGKPQHAVLFGCSIETDRPLVDKNLTSMQMLDYIIQIGRNNPTALHVGYGFKYDANMLIKNLPVLQIFKLWKNNNTTFTDGHGNDWTIGLLPGKKMTITKYKGRRPRTHINIHGKRDRKRDPKGKITVTIYDYSSFFGGSKFLSACEQILRKDLSDDDRSVIEHGKAERGQNDWSDLEQVRYYWEREIRLIQRTFEKFRNVMFQAGFALKEWYGPGALANYINAIHKIRPKLAAAQTTSGHLPDVVHQASKMAFSGGRFELFSAGRHQGPIYTIDINSAYPYALTQIPSLDPDVGEWRHDDSPSRIRRFGFYRISFTAPNARFIDYRPMPLFHRDHRGLISYPNRVHGWYASPEARMVLGMPGVTVHEGWHWDSSESDFPWEFLHEMFDTRMRLGKKNLLSLPFKLGPNSLYGKYAQTVGWNKKTKEPPKSHALPIAAWVTSYCRSMLWDVIRQIPDKVIGVETDSVFTKVDPSTLDLKMGDDLGEWGADVYDEMLYMQSGMYHARIDGEWTGTRSRGLHRTEFTHALAQDYLQSLIPGKDNWAPLRLQTKPRFIGAGAALARNDGMSSHCVWESQEREVRFGETGKRRHVPKACQTCEEGLTPFDKPHNLAIMSLSNGQDLSQGRKLPWESAHTPEVQELRDADERDKELITLA